MATLKCRASDMLLQKTIKVSISRKNKFQLLILCLSVFIVALFATDIAYSNDNKELEFLKFNPEIQVPGTHIEVGIWDTMEYGTAVGKVGFKIGDDLFYLEEAKAKKYDELDVFDSSQYAVFNDMLLIGVFGSPTGHGRWLFLFRYDENNVEIVDVMGAPNKLFYDFAEEYTDSPDKTEKGGNLYTLKGSTRGKAIFKIYAWGAWGKIDLFVEATRDGLKLILTPELYKELFKAAKLKFNKDRDYGYLMYGAITGLLDSNTIKRLLKNITDVTQ